MLDQLSVREQWEFAVRFRDQRLFELQTISFAHSVTPFCLATVVWNPHASSGTSMISEAAMFVLTVCSIYYD